MHEAQQVRLPVVSGLFYPADPAELEREIDALVGAHRAAATRGPVSALISPHAGYMYSGHTAGAGFARLEGERYDTVVVFSPSHRDYFAGISVYPGDAYRTPLGTIPIDAGLRDRVLRECPFVVASEAGHRQEHAVEVQLPFLQRTIREFALLPLVFGDQSHETSLELGKALARLIAGTRTLIVASTDLSHYHPAAEARRLDQVFIEDVRSGDHDRLIRDLERGATEACGGGPAVAILAFLRALGGGPMTLLEHRTSADVTGDRSSVVGYCSAVAYV